MKLENKAEQQYNQKREQSKEKVMENMKNRFNEINRTYSII